MALLIKQKIEVLFGRVSMKLLVLMMTFDIETENNAVS